MSDQPITRLTDHAIERGKERLGLCEKALQRTADRAFEYGVPVPETRGALRRYLDRQGMLHEKGNNTRVHAEHVFIFQGNVLITVLYLPNHLRRAARR